MALIAETPILARSGADACAVAPEGARLLTRGPIRALVVWPGFPYVCQVVLLICFVLLAILAWGQFAPDGVGAKLFSRTHLTTLLIWGLWWPAMLWAAVLLGRAWCAVCPLELVSNIGERLTRRLQIPQRSLPKWMATGGLVLGLYGVIHLLVAGADINRVPAYSAYFLTGLISLAAATAIVFKDRAYCRGFCPVGLLLNVYGRGGMLAVRPASGAACAACTTKNCVSAINRDRLDARSCPSLLNPATLASNKDCLLCGQCIKACATDNMQLLLRRPFPATDLRERVAAWPLTLFVMLDSGFVISELAEEVPEIEKAFLTAPTWVATRIGWTDGASWLGGGWAIVVFPLLLWWLLAAAARLLGARESFGALWRQLALPIAVVVSAAHMSKALAKFVSSVPFMPGALRDPGGIATARGMMAGTQPRPTALLDFSMAAIIGLVIVITALLLAFREQRLRSMPGTPILRERLPVALLACAFLAIIAHWPSR